jgi:hydroxymethylglutaryl-CoA lyase
VGVHLRGRPEDAEAKITAAYEAGCRRFDATIGGFGGGLGTIAGNDVLVSPVSTEVLLATLKGLGAEMPDIEALDRLITLSADMQRRFGLAVQ